MDPVESSANETAPPQTAAVSEQMPRRDPAVAGASLRAKAEEARAAAPVRTVLARLLGVHTEERAWRVGAIGEELVGRQLAKLSKKDPRWTSIHSIVVSETGTDIDHFVVGPGGVFTLNAKYHAGSKIWIGGDTYMVSGQRQHYIRAMRSEAGKATRAISAALGRPQLVVGVIVPVLAEDITIKSPPSDVEIVPRNSLVRWLRKQPEILDESTVVQIVEVASDPDTWANIPPAAKRGPSRN